MFSASGFITGYVFFTLALLPGRWRCSCGRFGAARSCSLPKRRRRRAGEVFPEPLHFGSGILSDLCGHQQGESGDGGCDCGLALRAYFRRSILLTRIKPGLLHEDFGRHALIGKTIAIGLVAAGLALLAVVGR